MNVNMNAEVKGYGAAVSPSGDHSDKIRAETRPVEPTNDSGRANVEEQSLQDRKAGERHVSDQEIAKAADELQKRLDEMSTNLQFSVDDNTESIVVKVTHRESGEVVRQIPSEEILDLKVKLEKLIGVLFDKEV